MTEIKNNPSWGAIAAPRYNKQRKKLIQGIKHALQLEEDKIIKDPHQGERKIGSLKEVWVKKFKVVHNQYLLAYKIDEKQHIVIFLAVGQHENFYRDLQKYLKPLL